MLSCSCWLWCLSSLLLDMTRRDYFIQINSLRLRYDVLLLIMTIISDRATMGRPTITRLIRCLALNLRRAIILVTDWKPEFIGGRRLEWMARVVHLKSRLRDEQGIFICCVAKAAWGSSTYLRHLRWSRRRQWWSAVGCLLARHCCLVVVAVWRAQQLPIKRREHEIGSVAMRFMEEMSTAAFPAGPPFSSDDVSQK